MSSLDYSTAIRGPQGWISTTRSSLSSTKTTAFVGSLTSDLQLGHKKYYRVYLQPLYITPPESSPFDHPHDTMRQLKFRQNSSTHLTCHKGCSNLVAAITVGIVFLLPTSSIKNRPHRTSYAPSCADVIWHITPSWRHRHVLSLLFTSRWCHLLTSTPHQPLMSSCLHHPLTCRVNCRCHWLWLLTLTGVDHWLFDKFDFLQSKCSLASFSHRFHFCIFFS